MYRVNMLGIIEGGYCDVRGLEGTKAAKFMQNLRHLPQIWFVLVSPRRSSSIRIILSHVNFI